MEKLKQIFSREDTVLFIGSGISLWSGLPSWSGLIDELAEFLIVEGFDASLVKQEKNRGDLLQAASYGFDSLTKQQIGEFIRKTCRYGQAEPHEIHNKIVSLGPKCFITTNYDNLIEKALQKWKSFDFYPNPITNRHLTEMANIVEAKATNYIFKPHGDAGDIESIILTREQYRRLLPQGESHSVLTSLNMIMTTRPIVYLGFGLRDPDFIYLRDLLTNTYRGAVRDHYAIMPNVTQTEKDYWRKNYGIHLVNYDAKFENNDHSALLQLLDEYTEVKGQKHTESFDPKSPNTVLNILRYTDGFSLFTEKESEFEITVNSHQAGQSFMRYNSKSFPVNEFLKNGPQKAILTGLPGAGKTYSIKRALSYYSQILNKECLASDFNIENATIPLFADLKLYKGNLEEQISQSLPVGLPLEMVLKHFKVKIFLDSFNEMPKEYWENNSYESDITNFVKKNVAASIIISSRTIDGLTKLEFPEYRLDLIAWNIVEEKLKGIGVEFTGKFRGEMHSLLQRPFYFQYVISGKIPIPSNAHPKDFYKHFFKNASKAFQIRFGDYVDLESVLSLAAYSTLNKGEETLLLADMLQSINIYFGKNNISVDSKEAVNWLISFDILIPYRGGRIAFIHQSITEYLASLELARQIHFDSDILFEKLIFTRWDQAIFLTLSHLTEESGTKFLKDVIKSDFKLALNAIKYSEFQSTEIVLELLSEIYDRSLLEGEGEWEYSEAINYSIPIGESHLPILYKLLSLGNAVSCAAANHLLKFKGTEVKEKILAYVPLNLDSFSFLTQIGSVINPVLTDYDRNNLIQFFLDKAEVFSQEANTTVLDNFENKYLDYWTFLQTILEDVPIDTYANKFLNEHSISLNNIYLKAFNEIIRGSNDSAVLSYALKLLMLGFDEASLTIEIATNINEKLAGRLDLWTLFNEDHVKKIIELGKIKRNRWSRSVLIRICNNRNDLIPYVNEIAETKEGLEKIFLFFCTGKNSIETIFENLDAISKASKSDIKKFELFFLQDLNLSWEGRDQLFTALLEMCELDFLNIFGYSSVPMTPKGLKEIDISVIKMLDWIASFDTNHEGWWNASRVGSIIGIYLTSKNKAELLEILKNGNKDYKEIILKRILSYSSGITTDDFDESIISFILSDLKNERKEYFFEHILMKTATEEFINIRLLPLLNSTDPIFLKNIKDIIRNAARRHGKRYLLIGNG